MKIHRASCVFAYAVTEERFVIEEILAVFGKKEARWFLVKWEGYAEPEYLLELDAKDAVRYF